MYKKIITKKSTNLSVMFNFSKTIEGMERYSKYLNDQKENWNTVKLVLHKKNNAYNRHMTSAAVLSIQTKKYSCTYLMTKNE